MSKVTQPHFLTKLLPAATLACAVTVAPAAPSLPFEVGAPFPDIVLPSLEDGRPTTVADFAGRKLALHVFASW